MNFCAQFIIAMGTLFDLYSGIGGLSLALQPEFKTVAYCENDPAAVAVLEKNMRNRRLHKAPIYPDVSKLTESDLNKLKPSCLSMGFPCQDISTAKHNAEGIDGVRSGSVMHVIRLVKDLSFVRLLFLENSPALRTRGLHSLEKALKTSGFNLCWGLFAACDVGSPQKRLRWYGIAYREGKDVAALNIPFKKRPWKLEPNIERVVPKSDAAVNRLQLLGNAVVPQCARFAFSTLCAKWQAGVVERKHACKLPTIRLIYPSRDVVRKAGWATPMRAVAGPCVRATHRCNSQLLGNALYSKPTTVKRPVSVNPLWVEWLQGYPSHYTQRSR